MKKLVKSARGSSIRADGKVMGQQRSVSVTPMFGLSSHASAAFLILCNRFLSALLQQSKLCVLKLIVNF
jgi:hypothetical protein